MKFIQPGKPKGDSSAQDADFRDPQAVGGGWH
jgi:hypothetical protein